MEGPETGDRGKDVNGQLEPFSRVILTPLDSIQLDVQGGPFVGHSCVGDTDEGITSGLYGPHLGGGIEHDFTSQLALDAELRGISAWGEHQLHSHGEVPWRHDGFDLRGQLLIGVSLWL